jgi:glucosamine--fructose-6-phosphate aminotransferase (isomerizing)
MCGIFGVVRAVEARHPRLASEAFVSLGRLAEERGRDAGGYALVSARHDGPASAPGRAIRQRYVELDGCTVVKAPAPFTRVWDRRHLVALDGASIALGHSRWATRGSPDAVANASPMVVGRLVGTHNGDVDEGDLVRRYRLGRRLGGTDTEVLFDVLDRAGAEPKEIATLLSAVRGRAALAWVDRGQADRVHLARAALSPLAIARDREANFYWASNPRWFRVLDVKGRFGFQDVTMVREGSYLSVVGGVMPRVDAERRFQALARERDVFAVAAVWRGFDSADMHLDRASCTHRVAAGDGRRSARVPGRRHRRAAPGARSRKEGSS